MAIPILCRGAACVLLITLIGCGKEPDAPAAGGQGGPAATAPVATADDVAGQWQAVKAETGSGGALPGGLQKDVLSSRTEIRPDHTYRSTNSMVGPSHGTWELNGNLLTLKPASTQTLLKATTLTFERPRLVSRDLALSVIYEKQGPAAADAGPKFTLTASQFLAEVAKDETAATKKYDGVPVEMTGVVTGIDLRASGVYVTVAGPPEAGKTASDLFGGIQCAPLEPEPWATIARLQLVKVSGVASVAYGAGSLSEARFTLVGPSILTTTTAEALAAEYAKDPEAARTKYTVNSGGKGMIVSGPVLEKHIESGRPSILVLGSGDARIRCEYSNEGSDAARVLGAIPVGQTVKLAGEFAPSPDGKALGLSHCMLITK